MEKTVIISHVSKWFVWYEFLEDKWTGKRFVYMLTMEEFIKRYNNYRIVWIKQ